MDEIKERGLTSENLKRLFSWDKSDWWWTVFFIILAFTFYGTYHDIKLCRELAENPCDQCADWVKAEAIKDTNQELQDTIWSTQIQDYLGNANWTIKNETE